jgi:hypothetical protein
VAIESLHLKDHTCEAFGRSIIMTNSNLSNLDRNGIHDMQILKLVLTVTRQTMNFLNDSWANMSVKEDI